jgi:hypothetical protein
LRTAVKADVKRNLNKMPANKPYNDHKRDPKTISKKEIAGWSEKRKREYMQAAKSEAREFQRKEALKAPPSRKQAIREHLKNEAGKKVAPVRKKHNKYYR